MVTWEYLVEKINTEYEIDEKQEIENSPGGDQILQRYLTYQGREGWELVAFLPACPAQHFKGDPPNPWVVLAVLKRPRSD